MILAQLSDIHRVAPRFSECCPLAAPSAGSGPVEAISTRPCRLSREDMDLGLTYAQALPVDPSAKDRARLRS